MKEKLITCLFVDEVLLIFVGMGFDLYSLKLGIKDIFYNTWISDPITNETNTVGTFSAMALMVGTIFFIFIPFMIKDDIEHKKFHPFTYLMSLASLSYCLYILSKGIPYIFKYFVNS